MKYLNTIKNFLKSIHYSYKLHLIICLMLFFSVWRFGLFWYELSHKIALLVVLIFVLGKELNDLSGLIKPLLTSNTREFSKRDFAVGFFPCFTIYLIIEITML